LKEATGEDFPRVPDGLLQAANELLEEQNKGRQIGWD